MSHTILNTSTLTPLPKIGDIYVYDFDLHCVGTTATTTLSICNLLPSGLSLGWSNLIHHGFDDLNLTGITLGGFGTYTFDVNFVPDHVGGFYTLWGDPMFFVDGLFITGTGVNSLLSFVNDPCFLNFGIVGLTEIDTLPKTITNLTNHDITISFSGNLDNFGVSNPVTLIPGSNTIDFTFNPQTIGNCTESLIMVGDCNDYLITLCGQSRIGGGVVLDVDNTSSYVGCCSTVVLSIYNNLIYQNNSTVVITSLTYPNDLVTDQTLPIVVDKGSCAVVEFEFCPTVSGFTSGNIDIQYSGQTFTGSSEIDIMLSAFTHPFATVDVSCIPFHCQNVQTEAILNITNQSNDYFEFYYYFIPDNGYNFYDIFTTYPDPPYTLPPFTTTGITISFDSSYLTTGSSFSDIFYIKLIDPNCCKELIKCINVSYCPTTVIPNFGYPVNVLCYGGCDGQYSFIVNDCSGGYHITWSADTTTPLATEIQSCRILSENGTCYFGEEDDRMLEYYDEISANNLRAGNYLLALTNACSATTYHSFTITQPDPLFVSITWTNPTNYCKSDISGLCGIVDSPDINPSGYVVLDKETLIKVINNDFHDIAGQTKRGYQQYDARENQVAQGQQVDGINSFRNYILNFFAGTFSKYKRKWEKFEHLTIQSWDEIVSETIGHGCCFASYVSGGTSPYIYQWYGPNGYTANSPNIFERPCCEPYTLVVTDAHGCTFSATSTCLQCTFGIQSLLVTNPTCTYSNDGEISVVISGNCPDAVYQIQLEGSHWVDTQTASTYNFIGLIKGDYILRVENLETECKLDPINVSLIPKYDFNIITNITGTTCAQRCDGIVEVVVNVTNNEDNVNPDFLYTLDGQYQTSNIFTGICSGGHVLNVLNTGNYCQITQQITVPNQNLFNIVTTVVPATGTQNDDGEIIITVVNGVTICNGSDSYILEDLNLAFDDIPNALIYDEDIECFITDEDDICYVEIEDTAPVCIDCRGIVNFTNNTYTITNVRPGTYYFTITDGGGCSKTFKVIVGYSKIKTPKTKLFDSKRSDLYSGSKVTGNTPKGQ